MLFLKKPKYTNNNNILSNTVCPQITLSALGTSSRQWFLKEGACRLFNLLISLLIFSSRATIGPAHPFLVPPAEMVLGVSGGGVGKHMDTRVNIMSIYNLNLDIVINRIKI